jgi:hypothetical protein
MDSKAIHGVLTLLLIVLMLAPLSAAAQGTVETQKGLPPDPNATSPEYARPQPAPERPALEPAPGKPALAPKPPAEAERGQRGGLARTFLRLWPVLLLGSSAVLLVFAAANARRRRNGPP